MDIEIIEKLPDCACQFAVHFIDLKEENYHNARTILDKMQIKKW